LIEAGTQLPQANEFGQMPVRRGIKTPQQKLREFLNSNPNHLDARRDLLKERSMGLISY